MSDTPRVDAFIASHPWVAGQSQDMINFAKELELELHNTLPSDLSELIKFWRTFPPSSNEVAAAEIIEKLQRILIRPEAKSPVSRSRTALPANIRKTLEESNLPVEVATAIADLCEGLIRPEEERIDPWETLSLAALQLSMPSKFKEGAALETIESALRSREPQQSEGSHYDDNEFHERSPAAQGDVQTKEK